MTFLDRILEGDIEGNVEVPRQLLRELYSLILMCEKHRPCWYGMEYHPAQPVYWRNQILTALKGKPTIDWYQHINGKWVDSTPEKENK